MLCQSSDLSKKHKAGTGLSFVVRYLTFFTKYGIILFGTEGKCARGLFAQEDF